MEFRKDMKSSLAIENLKQVYREKIPFIENDIEMHIEMKKSIAFVQTLVRV
jgi:histidine ammonia-lyase